MEQALTSTFGLGPELLSQIAALGQRNDPEALARNRRLFAAGHDSSLPQGGSRHEDVPYGHDPRHGLDICQPPGRGNPIALFVPGGGFTGGDKRFYAHIPFFFARRGLVGAAMNYRLAPEHGWPSGGQDVAAAVDWLVEHAEEYGGDPSRIVLVAQSAGAAHTATALFDPRFRPKAAEAVLAVVLMSGIYEVHAEMGSPNAPKYFGEDPEAYSDRSVLRHVAGSNVPVVMTISEFDPTNLVAQGATLLKALTARDSRSPTFVWLAGHNHVSPVLHFGSRDDRLGDALIDHLNQYLNPMKGCPTLTARLP